jgi:hypothetical protein
MTTISNLCSIALIAGASFAFAEDPPAQTAAPTADATLERDIQIARSLTEVTRQATVAANVTLSDTQSKAFWPLYRDYRTAVAKQNDRLQALILKYAAEYNSVSDAAAKDWTKTYLDIDQKRLDLKKQYTSKFQKILPGALVARVMQTEQKLDAMQQFTLARTIPLVPATGK